MAKYKNSEFKLIIGEEKALYISTLSDLGGYMLKLDFPMGEYGLYPFMQGYYLGAKDYTPKSKDAIQVFSTRDGHYGLSGTYHNGDTDNVHLVRIFNNYIGEHLPDAWWQENYFVTESDEFESDESDTDESVMEKFETDESETDESAMDESAVDESAMDKSAKDKSAMDESESDESYHEYKRDKVTVIQEYNNIPVFFYLTKQINIDDLSCIKLQSAPVINECGNIDLCWYVLHAKSRIGIAVKQKDFYCMMGDQAGLCLFSSNGFRAVGNFNFYDKMNDFDEDVFYPRHTYKCEYKPCHCYFESEYTRKLREDREKRNQYLRSCNKRSKVN